MAVACLMMVSCNDDDPSKTNNPTGPEEPEVPEVPEEPEEPAEPGGKKLVFAVANNAIGGYYTFWIVMSGKDGAVLDTAQLENNSEHTLQAPAAFTDEEVTLTIVSNYTGPGSQDKETIITSYTHVPFGQYGRGPIAPFVMEPVQQEATVYVQAAGNLNLVVSGPALRMSQLEPVGGNNTMIRCGLVANQSGVLIAKIENPFQFLYKDVTVNRTYTVSINDFLPAGAQDISIPDAGSASIYLEGVNDAGRFGYYSYNEDAQGEMTGQMTVPVIPDLFTSYEVNMSLRNGKVVDTYTYRGSEIPVAMKQVDGTIQYAGTDNVISWHTTGTLDVVRLSVRSFFQHQTGSWLVYGPTGDQQVTLPIIPANIPVVAGDAIERSFGASAAEHGIETEIQEVSESSSYVDVLVKPSLVPGTPYDYTEILRRVTKP
jgi:hypothetical protein